MSTNKQEENPSSSVTQMDLIHRSLGCDEHGPMKTWRNLSFRAQLTSKGIMGKKGQTGGGLESHMSTFGPFVLNETNVEYVCVFSLIWSK